MGSLEFVLFDLTRVQEQGGFVFHTHSASSEYPGKPYSGVNIQRGSRAAEEAIGCIV